MMNGELLSLGDVNPKTTLKGVQLSPSYNPLTYDTHTSSHPSDGLLLFVTRPTKRAACSRNPPRARQCPTKVRRGICWHIALSLRSSVTLGNNGPLQNSADWWRLRARVAGRSAASCVTRVTGKEAMTVWKMCNGLRVFKSFLRASPPSLSLVLLQFYIHINGVGDCGGYQLMGNHKREKKVHTTVSVLLWGALFFKANSLLQWGLLWLFYSRDGLKWSSLKITTRTTTTILS